MWKKIKLNLEYAYSTGFGFLRIYKTCNKWDKVLNDLIDKYGDNPTLTSYTIYFGDNEVWIRNRFHGYGGSWSDASRSWSYTYRSFKLPKRKTAIRLALIEDRLRLEVEVKQKEEYEQMLNNIN